MTKRSYICLFSALLFFKIILSLIIFFHTGNRFFGGGNDGDYYHAYAIGEIQNAVNIWPVILRWLNDYLYYNRDLVIFIINIIGSIAIPLSIGALITPHKKNDAVRKNFWIIATIIAAYPSLYFQSVGIYRDVVMLFIFILFLFCCKKLSFQKSIFSLIVALILAYVLYKFRPYLGVACFVTLIISPLYNLNRHSLLFTIGIYLLSLTIIFHYGYLEPITNTYRDIFSNIEAGSNLNLRFSDTMSFIPTLLKSWAYQIGGLFFTNTLGILVFLMESVPFLFALFYILKNRHYSNRFINYLAVFFISYTTVWVLGNDNLGTAVRLRIPSYIVIFMIAFIIKSNKKLIQLSKQNNIQPTQK